MQTQLRAMLAVATPGWVCCVHAENVTMLVSSLPDLGRVISRDMERYTIALALRASQGSGQTPRNGICAGATAAVAPLLLIFVKASRHLVDHLTADALKT